MTDQNRPYINPLLELSEFDSASSRPMTLCSLPGEDRQVRFALPTSYIDLVQLLDGTRTIDEAIDEFMARNPETYEKSWLQKLVETGLIPKGILIYPHQDPKIAGISRQKKRAFLYLKLPIIPPSIVDPIARQMGFLYNRFALIAGVIMFVAMHVYVYAILFTQHEIDFNQLDATGILLLMLLSTLGTFFHEFGHASAAAHFGCRKITIGWGLYIIYTVLWTDVSEAWKLPRKQRAIVDIGGVYFESIFLLIMLLSFIYTGNTLFIFAFIFIDLSIATTLNPFLRMDGYWLMSDLFGIVNLRSQQMAWLNNIGKRLFSPKDHKEIEKVELDDRAKRVLIFYSITGFLFFFYIIYIIYKIMILKVFFGFPDFFEATLLDYRSGMSASQMVGAFLEIAWRVLMLAGAGFMIIALIRRGAKLVGKVREFRSPDQKQPVAEAKV